DAVTAVSGSGPAYVFNLVEALAAAGMAQGLDEAVAMRLARQTVIGAAALMEADPTPVSVLRQNVTSPQGTTAAALEVLMGADGLTPLMGRALGAARRRSEELGQGGPAGPVPANYRAARRWRDARSSSSARRECGQSRVSVAPARSMTASASSSVRWAISRSVR